MIAFLLADPIRVEVSQPQHALSVAEVVAQYCWPVVALIALLILQRPIRTFIENIATRATEVSLGSWATFKLPGLKQAPEDQVILNFKDLQGSVWQESGSNLLAQFQNTRTPEYALLDLGEGGEWISSRLFIFAVMLQRMKGLRCIVFVSSTANQQATYVGCASPDNVRWRLAADQPWLEAAFAHAYANMAGLPQGMPRSNRFVDIKGALQPQTAQIIVSMFIQNLKEPAPHLNPDDFVTIHSGDEHATWITVAELERILGTDLWTDAVAENTDQTPEAKRLQARRFLNKPHPYVAQTRDGAFVSLVSRVALLDEVADTFK
jgi:hypothetical protein